MGNLYASEEFLRQLLTKAVSAGASDIHLKVGQPPGVRVSGDIVYFKTERLTPEDTKAAARIIVEGALSESEFAALLEYECSYPVPGVSRFRVSVFRQRGSYSVVLRAVSLGAPEADKLGLPAPVTELAMRERGLVLVVGAAGNGKSTTLAAMIHCINAKVARHIVTIEDPIEFLHTDLKSCVSQREVGRDTKSFAAALKSALRQDPDVILVGEIRDTETMEIAVQAAETGHLVLSSLHTPDVGRTLNRLLALSENPTELRERIADSLQGILAQRLVPNVDGGVALALEILVATGTVREALKRPEQNPPLKELMERGVTPYGMQTFQMAFRALLKQGRITKEIAAQYLG
ncbi:MAG: PilT/PilU family type 4a pilus ATPase [Myxococcales bacterium]|nr:PilT/PilU family type 4a pilus ATPase [Myxococcales bacterium]